MGLAVVVVVVSGEKRNKPNISGSHDLRSQEERKVEYCRNSRNIRVIGHRNIDPKTRRAPGDFSGFSFFFTGMRCGINNGQVPEGTRGFPGFGKALLCEVEVQGTETKKKHDEK